MFEAAGLLAVKRTHFLQAHDVCIKLLHGVAEVVDFKTTRRPKTLHAFVDVVGGDFECFHVHA
jgi:hypothetical protein